MLESKVEREFAKQVQARGGRAYKFVSPGRRGVTDRLVLFPIPGEHRDIVKRYIRFVELKAPGQKPKSWQNREHERLQKLGFCVEVIDGI